MKNIYAILLLFFLAACSQDKSKNQDIVFDIDFKPQSRFAGTFHDIKGAEYVYFAEPVTRKYLKVFSTTGQYLYTVPLKEAVNSLQEVSGIQVLAKDTILLHSLYDNQFCAINSQGKIYKKFVLNDFCPDIKNMFETWPSYNSYSVSGNKMLFFHHWWAGTIDDKNKGKIPAGGLEYNKYLYKGRHYSPYLIKVTNIIEKPTIEFGADSFYTKLSPIISDFSELPYFSHTNHKVFILSWYSSDIFVVNENTLKIENRVPIRSQYTEIGMPAVPIDSINEQYMKDNPIQFAPKGTFRGVFFNQKQKTYNIFISYRIRGAKDTTSANKPTHSFSVITLDSTFKQIAENSFIGKGYENVIIPIKNGLLINKERKPNDKKFIFTLFKDL